VRCADAFLIVAWAGDALELVRRQTWNTARKAGMSVHARDLKGARYAPWKNPDRLTDRQQAKLAWVAKVNHRHYRAYLLKEQLREVFALKGEGGRALLDRWLSWARRCRIPAFVELAQRIVKHRARRSTPPLNTDSPTASWRARTPRSGCSPAWRSASSPRTR